MAEVVPFPKLFEEGHDLRVRIRGWPQIRSVSGAQAEGSRPLPPQDLEDLHSGVFEPPQGHLGTIELEIHEPGALVPARQEDDVFEVAVEAGEEDSKSGMEG